MLGGNIFLGGWLESGTAWEEAWVSTVKPYLRVGGPAVPVSGYDRRF